MVGHEAETVKHVIWNCRFAGAFWGITVKFYIPSIVPISWKGAPRW
jgi:hypothetical protein